MNISSVETSEIRRVRHDVVNSRMRALHLQPFFASVGLQLNIIVCRKVGNRAVPTAAVAGKNLYVNPDWYMELTKAKKVGLIMHEILHKALGHDLRREDRHPDVWNYACDYYINVMLTDHHFDLPEDGLIDERFRGWSEERIYKYMMDRATYVDPEDAGGRQDGKIDPDNIQILNKKGKRDEQEASSGSDESGETDSSHSQDEGCGASEEQHTSGDSGSEGEDGQGDGSPIGSGGGSQGSECSKDVDDEQGNVGCDSGDREVRAGEESDGLSGSDQASGEVGSPPEPKDGEGDVIDKLDALNVPWGEVWDAETDDGKPLTVEQKEDALKRLKEDLYASARANRDAGASSMLTALRIIDHLVKPKADWKKDLRSFISANGKAKRRTFARLDRRGLAQDLYNPGEFSESIGRIIALWDVSSSMDYVAHRALLAQLAEMRKTVEMTELTIAPFNTYVNEACVARLGPKDKLPDRFPVGGGTSFNGAFDWVKSQKFKPDAVIVFTDMEARLRREKPPYPVMWVSSKPVPDHRIPPWGKVIVIDGGE